MSDSNVKNGFPNMGGFPTTTQQGFPAQKGFPNAGFPAAIGGFLSSGFPSMKADDTVDAELDANDEADIEDMNADVNDDTNKGTIVKRKVDEGPKEGKAPKNVKYFEGSTKLNKTETNHTWKEFGGEKLATYAKDGSGYITRIIERESKKTGVYFKVTEKLTKDANGYGVIAWRIELGSIVRRKPASIKFDESWGDSILIKVMEVVQDGVSVSAASRSLAEELGVSFSTMRANLWVADKWSKGETTTFLPHRSMIKPIFDLLCELEKKEETLTSMEAYCSSVKKPSEFVVNILKVHGRI